MNLSSLKALDSQTYFAPRGGAGYPMPVLFYIPKACKGLPKKYVLYIHGWRGICDHASDDVYTLFKNFKLGEAIEKSGIADTIFVMPLSRGNCDDFKKFLAPKFSQFMDWLRTIFNTDIDTYFAGHSGAYSPMCDILLGAPHFTAFVKGIVLLDAVYARADDFIQVMKGHLGIKLVSYYLKRGGTEYPSKNIVQEIGSRAKAFPAQTTEHCQVPSIHLGTGLLAVMS